MNGPDFRKAADYWKERMKPCEDRSILEASVNDILGSFPSCTIATASEGMVDATPVHYIWHNGAVYIFSEGGDKFANLEKNRKVCVSVYNHDGDFGNLRSVQVYGNAEFTGLMSDEYMEIAGCARYPLKREYLEKRAATDPLYLIRIIPERYKILDSWLAKQGYSSNQELTV